MSDATRLTRPRLFYALLYAQSGLFEAQRLAAPLQASWKGGRGIIMCCNSPRCEFSSTSELAERGRDTLDMSTFGISVLWAMACTPIPTPTPSLQTSYCAHLLHTSCSTESKDLECYGRFPTYSRNANRESGQILN